ncbi:uncharacterized protein LOC141701919 isoform X2 [Apium graveolens]|uniref:uncharacterized protein LOC141701919 isoform X2 n=1 Tax=Apium graveolens TaxID=4045 RepID=UPI003D7B53CC
MEKSRRNVVVFIFSLIIILPQIMASTGAVEQGKQSISDRFRDVYGIVTASSMSSLHKLKSLINDVQQQLFPPNLEPKIEEEVDEEGAKEWMKEAVKKSVGSTKSTVEETAKSAASAVEDVVHKTKEKVSKKHCTGDACSHDEL